MTYRGTTTQLVAIQLKLITRCVHHQSESPRAPVLPPAVGLTLFRDSSRQQKYDVIHRLPPHTPFPPLLDADWSARFCQQETAAVSPTAGAVNSAL